MRLAWLTVPRSRLDRGRSDVDVHTACWDGPTQGPVFVCVHGLGGSHVNWALLAQRLADRGTVYAPDLAGFGLTPPTGRRPTVDDNLDLLSGFVRTVSPDRPVILLGNSMGGLLTLLLCAARPRLVERAVLIAPASPRPLNAPVDPRVVVNFAAMAVPGLGERFLARRQARTTPAQQVRETMLLCAADPDRLDADLLDKHVDLVRRRRELPYARAAMLHAARSLLKLIGPGQRRVWKAVDDSRAPTLLIHGAKDRLVLAGGIERLAARRGDWEHITYDDLGHVPMLEAPDRLADDILIWLDQTQESSQVLS